MLRTIDEAFRLSTIQLASVTRENLVLQETIGQHVKVETMLQRDTQEIFAPVQQKETVPKSSEETKKRLTLMPQLQGDGGWCVHFPEGKPSFYFSPFTKVRYDDILNNNDIAYAERHPCTATVGEILGWSVDYAPLAKNADGTSFMAHARFTRSLRCSLDKAEKILPRLDKKLWPVLVTPRSWGRVHSGSVHCQVLQNFDKNSHVIAYNIPGEVNLRYIALARHSREKIAEGKRVDKYIITIADSEANARNREAEGGREDVQWILEGGTYITITEVDHESIDVVFDQWAGCLSEMHGRELYIVKRVGVVFNTSRDASFSFAKNSCTYTRAPSYQGNNVNFPGGNPTA